MNILVCIKRVPDIGAKVELTEDQRAIVTKNLGFTISPHEECAVEEAVQRIEKDGGDTTVLTLGPEGAEEQIRDSLARGVERGILLETDGNESPPGSPGRFELSRRRAMPTTSSSSETRPRTPGTFRWPSVSPTPSACRA